MAIGSHETRQGSLHVALKSVVVRPALGDLNVIIQVDEWHSSDRSQMARFARPYCATEPVRTVPSSRNTVSRPGLLRDATVPARFLRRDLLGSDRVNVDRVERLGVALSGVAHESDLTRLREGPLKEWSLRESRDGSTSGLRLVWERWRTSS